MKQNFTIFRMKWYLTLINLKDLNTRIYQGKQAYFNFDNLMSKLYSMTTNLRNNPFGNDKDEIPIF